MMENGKHSWEGKEKFFTSADICAKFKQAIDDSRSAGDLAEGLAKLLQEMNEKLLIGENGGDFSLGSDRHLWGKLKDFINRARNGDKKASLVVRFGEDGISRLNVFYENGRVWLEKDELSTSKFLDGIKW